MAKQVIALGSAPNGLDGDDARTAFQKTNANFDELYGGTISQPTNAKLSAIAALVWSANQMMYTTGTNTLAMAPLTAAGRALLDDPNAAAQRVTLGLGTLATVDAQTAANDATAGRALLVGAFGLGGSQGVAVPNSDLNDCGLTGFYNIASNTVNVPVGASSGSVCFTQCFNGASSAHQLVFGYAASRLWFRRRNNGTWSDWEETVKSSSIGTSAGGTLTTSTLDNTLGRVLRVGDFGIGNTCVLPPTPTSLASITASGFYYCGATVDDGPLGSGTGASQGYIHHYRHPTSGYAKQVFTSVQTPHRTYERVQVGGVWQPWQYMLKTVDIVGTVSQNGGVPTGAIVERGSNANGEYVRFADGTQICWGLKTYSSGITSVAGGVYISPAGDLITWPVPFYSNLVSLSGGVWSGSYRVTILPYRSNTLNGTFTFELYSSVPSGVDVVYTWHAIGRWY